ncbi:MAG: RNA-binding protein [Thaumarchaeota archaeon]|nr:RNA-binding protein [Nitrososphaerota archaeon]MBI3641852.1 RNA-binding protein [Nitrososphaerota archaeon]
MSLKNVKSSLSKISKSLEEAQNSREYIIKRTREVVILCSQAIISVHKLDITDGKEKAAKAKKLLDEIRKKSNAELYRHIMTSEQELVEAFAFLAIVQKSEIPSAESLGVKGESYILGLLDCIGELKRLVYDSIRAGKAKDANKFFEIMENLYLSLYPFAIYDKLVNETRRKLDVNRILIEDVRAAVTEEIRRSALIDSINKFKK